MEPKIDLCNCIRTASLDFCGTVVTLRRHGTKYMYLTMKAILTNLFFALIFFGINKNTMNYAVILILILIFIISISLLIVLSFSKNNDPKCFKNCNNGSCTFDNNNIQMCHCNSGYSGDDCSKSLPPAPPVPPVPPAPPVPPVAPVMPPVLLDNPLFNFDRLGLKNFNQKQSFYYVKTTYYEFALQKKNENTWNILMGFYRYGELPGSSPLGEHLEVYYAELDGCQQGNNVSCPSLMALGGNFCGSRKLADCSQRGYDCTKNFVLLDVKFRIVPVGTIIDNFTHPNNFFIMYDGPSNIKFTAPPYTNSLTSAALVNK